MEIRQLLPDEEYKWNTFVDNSEQGSIYSKSWFVKSLGFNYKIYVVERNKEIFAGILLGNWKGIYTFGPLQKYSGILFGLFEGHPINITANQRAATRLILDKIRSIDSFDYFFHPAYPDWLLFYQAGYKEITYYTYKINLQGLSEQGILEMCAPRLRTKIRKNLRESLGTIVTNVEPDTFYEVNNKTFERQGGKFPVSKEKFLSIVHALQTNSDIKLYGIHVDGNISTVLGIAYDTQTAYLMMSGFDPNQKNANLTELLIYKALCDARGKVNFFDFEGSMLPGIESFYRQFGGVLTPYFRIYKPSLINRSKHTAVRLYKKIMYGK